MNAHDTAEYMSVLKTVRDWPPAQRFELVQQVLSSLEHELAPRPRMDAEEFARLYGLLATDRPPPTDEEVKQMLEEERMKKYG